MGIRRWGARNTKISIVRPMCMATSVDIADRLTEKK
jgi:hypothetical protein